MNAKQTTAIAKALSCCNIYCATMTDENTIRVVEIQETEFGEKAVVDSPFEARFAIKFLPWQEHEEELEEYGSLREKAEERFGANTKSSDMVELFDAMEQYGFSKDFASHASWDPDALDGGGAWTVDVEAMHEAADFWQFFGYDVVFEVGGGGG